MATKPRIEPGAIRVSTVQLWYETPNIEVWDIDCHTKYYETHVGSTSMNDVCIFLGKNENTLRPDPTRENETRIIFPDHPGTWLTTYSGGRYSVHVVMYKVPDKVIEGWNVQDLVVL